MRHLLNFLFPSFRLRRSLAEVKKEKDELASALLESTFTIEGMERAMLGAFEQNTKSIASLQRDKDNLLQALNERETSIDALCEHFGCVEPKLLDSTFEKIIWIKEHASKNPGIKVPPPFGIERIIEN